MFGKRSSRKNKSVTLLLAMVMVLQIFAGGFGGVSFAEGPDDLELAPVETPVDLDETGETTTSGGVDFEPVEPITPGAIEPGEDPDKEPGESEVDKEAPPEMEKTSPSGVEMSLMGGPVLMAEPKDLGNIFTFKYLEVNDKEASQNMVVDIVDGTSISLGYTWNVSDANPGDFAEIDIPEAFKIPVSFESPKDIIITGDKKVGTYKIVNNKLRFDFDEGIADVGVGGYVENGTVGFAAKFNKDIFTTDVVEEIKFNDSSDKIITIIGKPTTTVKSIDKKGIPDSSQDAKEITWTIDVANPSNTAINDAKVTDLLPAGLEIDASSVKVYNLDVKLNGDLSKGNEVIVDSPTIAGQNFEVNLPTIAPYKGYRIEYTTTIKDKSITEFTNDALFEYNGKRLPAEATVSGLTRSDLIEKDGKENGGNIDWWIDVNKAGGSISEAIIGDTLPTGTTLIPGSIEIVKLTQNGDNWNESESDKTAIAFPVNLGKLGSEDAYRIKFKTEIDYSEVNGGDYQKDNNFKNRTILRDGTTEVGDAEKIVKITRKPILAKIGSPVVNYEKKEIKWTVTVNEANHKIDDAIITDTLPAGLTIAKTDIKVFKGAVDVTDDITIVVPDNTGATPTEVTIEIGNITEKYTIEYTTKITDLSVNTFENGVGLGGTGVGIGGAEIVKPVNPPMNIFNKSKGSINYNEKTMSWTITADPRREAINELKITDTFPNKGLILLPETLVVKIGGDKKTIVTDYELTQNDAEGFVVEFKPSVLPINVAITIEYETSYDPEKGINPNTSSDGKYINNARFDGKTASAVIGIDKNDSQTVKTESWNSGKKLGKLISIDEDNQTVNGWVSGDQRRIEWEVYINYLEQNLGTGVSVEDVLGYDGQVDISGIIVKKYTVAKDGNTTLGNAIDSSSYSVVPATDNKGFTLSFNSDFEVKERYAIIFTTSVPDISLGIYTNKATTKDKDNNKYLYTGTVGFDKADNNLSKSATGITGSEVYTDDEIDWKIKINEALSSIEKDVKIVDTISSGMVYKEGSLEITKVGGGKLTEDEDYTLSKLINDDGETVLTIVFKYGISSTYEIEYTTVVTAIDGKVNNKVDYSGTNLETKSVTTDQLSASQSSYVGGDPAKGKIKISKRDETGSLITALNAKFVLWYELNGVDQKFQDKTFETVNGVVEIGNLPLNRTYYLEEVESPAGYVLYGARIKVEVEKATGSNDANAYLIDVKNIKEKIEVIGTKIWIDGPKLKPTIDLQLYRNGKVFEAPITLVSGKTEHTWKNLDKTDNAGVDYVYTVKEVGKPENYEKVEEGLTVTNTYVIPKTEVLVTKEWLGGPEAKPEIELQLYQNGVALEDYRVILASGMLTHKWTDLDLTDENGVEYIYTVDEVKVPNYYVKRISQDGLIVTNVYSPPSSPSDPEGRIRIIKKDRDSNELLSGAEFDILDSKGKRVDALTTNSKGEATSKWLPVGEYTIEEKKAPKGYKLDTRLGQERVRNRETVEIVIYNEKQPEEPVIPVEPTDPDPIDPTDPTKPTDPKEPNKPDKPNKPGESEEFEDFDTVNPAGGTNIDGPKPLLPKTGSQSTTSLLILGLVALTLGLMLRIKRISKKPRKKSKYDVE